MITNKKNVSVSVMIFTLNEETNLPLCLDSLRWCSDIIVIDSYSTDKTREICKGRENIRFFQNKFKGFGKQRNWALDHSFPKNEWVLILDADEQVPPELAQELIRKAKSSTPEIGAYRVRRRFHMWGKWLKYSSLYPTWFVRFIHRDKVRYINRGHAETQNVKGKILALENDLTEQNLKGIDEWFERQNRYSTHDAAYELSIEKNTFVWKDLISRCPLKRRAALKRLIYKLPARSLIFFLYNYFYRRGFLDGKNGFIFSLMKAMYQQMVVIKKYDISHKTKQDK